MGMKKNRTEGAKTAEDHTRGLSEHHEDGVVNDKAHHGHVSVEAVFHQIGSYGIAETIEEIGADADERKVDPGLVAEKVCKGFEGEFLCPDRFEALLREEAAGQGSEGGHSTQQDAQNGILVLGVPSYHSLKIREGEQHHKAHGVGSYHPVRGELVLLVVIVRHHAQKGAVRDVHGRIHHHRQQIEGVGINALAGRAQIRGIQQQGKDRRRPYTWPLRTS